MKTFFNILALCLLCGCSMVRTLQVDGDGRLSKTTAITFFDSKSNLGKLRTSNTDKTQAVTIADLTQEASGSNTVNLLHAVVEAAVTAAAKSIVPTP